MTKATPGSAAFIRRSGFDALYAAGAGELARLEALAAEHGTALGRTEGHRSFLPASRAVRRGFDSLSADGGASRRARRTLRLAGLAAFRLVLEILVGEEELLAGSPNEGGPAVYAVEGLILELHYSIRTSLAHPVRSHPPTIANLPPSAGGLPGNQRSSPGPGPTVLLRLAALLLARPLPRQRLFRAATIAGLQIEGMLLDILDDIFLLDLPLEPAKRAFDGLAILHFDFSQA